MEQPSNRIAPLSRRYTPVSTLISVLLPAPFSPIKAWISPRRSVKSTPSRARTPGKTLLTFRAWSNGWSQEFLITLKISTGQWRYSKRVESPLRAHRAADGERHTHAAVPGRQIAALGRFTHRFPIATIRTDGELKAIAAPGRQAQINARPDDVVHFGDGLVLVVLAPP